MTSLMTPLNAAWYVVRRV